MKSHSEKACTVSALIGWHVFGRRSLSSCDSQERYHPPTLPIFATWANNFVSVWRNNYRIILALFRFRFSEKIPSIGRTGLRTPLREKLQGVLLLFEALDNSDTCGLSAWAMWSDGLHLLKIRRRREGFVILLRFGKSICRKQRAFCVNNGRGKQKQEHHLIKKPNDEPDALNI